MIKRLGNSFDGKRWERKSKLIAEKLGISKCRVQQIYKEYKETGEIPKLKRRGRGPKSISKEEVELVLSQCLNIRGQVLFIWRSISNVDIINISHTIVYILY